MTAPLPGAPLTSSAPVSAKAAAKIPSKSLGNSHFHRSTSPESISRVLHSLNSSRADVNRPSSRDIKSSSPNVHRWSHSTASSTSVLDTDLIGRRNSSTGATRKQNTAATPKTGAPAYGHFPRGRTSPRNTGQRGPATMSMLDSSRLNFQDSSNVTVVRDLTHNGGAASAEAAAPKWERRPAVNKGGESGSGVSLQYTAEPAVRLQALPNGAALPERRSSTGQHGHRNRSANRSKDTSQTSIDSAKSDQSKKGHRSPQQKDMLSKALAKANTAVLLDNAQDITGAIEAYNEACLLLEQVMLRSTDPEDRRKLSAIKATYSSRIAELHELNQAYVDMLDKALPEEPHSDDYDAPDDYFHDDASFRSRASKEATLSLDLPLRQESLLPQIFGGESFLQDRSVPAGWDPRRHSPLSVPMDKQYMPSPLTPRHPLPTPTKDESIATTQHARAPTPTGELVAADGGATSWLENVDTTSSRSSSRLSSDAFGPHNGQLVSDIEAEFDAAMNAAVEAAYEEQPSQEPTPRGLATGTDRYPGIPSAAAGASHHATNPYLDAEGEDEERLLEEMTREFGLDGRVPMHRPKPSIPRQSDSSGFSSRTWGSSVASTTATAGTALSTLAEAAEPVGSPDPPAQSTSKPPGRHSRTASQLSMPSTAGDKHVPIRDRRMSGQSAQQLKIETFNRRGSSAQKPLPPLAGPNDDELDDEPPPPPQSSRESANPAPNGSLPTPPLASVHSEDSNGGESPVTPGPVSVGSTDDHATPMTVPPRSVPMMPPPPPPATAVTRKHVSSTSLRKQSLSINTAPAEVLESPATPGSAMFPPEAKRRPSTSTPAISTPGANGLTTGHASGLQLFEDYAGNPESPPPIETSPTAPAPLEPCPESFLLRPFWLMRTLYLALSHPHGGFVTQKLFLPREMWRTRNVKIKALEDKISTCDLLTAALLKLSRVDTLDADVVLMEMQSFETILDQARGTLTKKLGSEVGVAGTTIVFKQSPAGEDVDSTLPKPATASLAAKSLASWGRKLRSKSSSANLSTGGTVRDSAAQGLTMPTLPMTTLSSVPTSRSYGRSRNPPPTPSQLPSMLPPMAVYLSSLARLFEAVQILDSLARQVEDPGLKFSSQTQVGLELSVRNAAEFFAFYVVRFVMSDLLLLVDKFLKRSSEWVTG